MFIYIFREKEISVRGFFAYISCKKYSRRESAEILRVGIEADSSVKPRQIEANVTRRVEISSPFLTQFEFPTPRGRVA